MTNIYLTGSTGFVGQGLLHYLTHTKFNGKIHLAIREKRGETAIERFEKIKLKFSALNLEICPIPIVELHKHKIPDITCIINCAAAIDFNLDIRDALHQNVDGLKSLIAFSNNNQSVTKFIHISTAYVSSSLTSLIPEEFINLDVIHKDVNIIYEQIQSGKLTFEDLKKKHYFPNTYCATKCIAEKIIELEIEKQHKVDYSIIRPSIITNSISIPYNGWFQGYAASNGIYTMMLEKYLPSLVINETVQLNNVPIDYVCLVIYNTIYKNKIQIQHAVFENSPSFLNKIIYFNKYFSVGFFSVVYKTLAYRLYIYYLLLLLNIQYCLCMNYKQRLQITVLCKNIINSMNGGFYTFLTNTYNFDIRVKYDFSRPTYIDTNFKYFKSVVNSLIFKRQLFKLQDPSRQSYLSVAYNVWHKYFSFILKNNIYYGILMIYSLIAKFVLNKMYKNVIVEMNDMDRCIYQTKPILIVSNHLSHMDTVVLKYLFLSHKYLKLYNPIVIATDDFKKISSPVIQQMLAYTNIKYISRDNFDKEDFIRFLNTYVSSNTNILLFPEGTRSRDKTISQFKSGIYKLMKTHIDFQVLPISIAYSYIPETSMFIDQTKHFKLFQKTNGICCVRLNDVIQAPDSITEIENIVVQNHHYLQNKYYDQLSLNCDDPKHRFFNHMQYMKFERNVIEYDTNMNPKFPVLIDSKRILYPLHKDLINIHYDLGQPLILGEYSINVLGDTIPQLNPEYVLITGATGLIGTNFMRMLISQNKNEKYLIISRNVKQNKIVMFDNIEFHLLNGDITNLSGIEDYEFKLWSIKEVYHFAGIASHHKNDTMIKNMIETNMNGTKNICELVQLNQIIHKSSLKVTYMSTSGVVVKGAIHFPYYKSKIDAEEHIIQHAKEHKYQLNIFRPSIVVGDVDIELLQKLQIEITTPKENFFNKIKNGKLKFCMDTNINAITCDELLNCVFKAKYKSIQIYNCSGLNYKLIDIFNHYKQTNFFYMNAYMIGFLYAITHYVNILPSLHYYMRMGKCEWSIDTSKSRKDLGFSPVTII